jgi:phenylacetic acid degradation operon negative regulatory protein
MTIATMDGATRTRMFGVLVLVGKPVSAPELVTLCRPLGISATNVKSHLTRMVAEGVVFRTGPRRAHRYTISPQRQAIVQAISRRLESERAERWDGHWLMVALKPQTSRADRQRLRDSLWFDGFRPCGPDTYVRPAWPSAWAVARGQSLASVASACVKGPFVGTLHLGQVRKLYRLTSLDAQARKLVRQIQTVADGVDSPEDAFKARLTIGGLVVGLMSHVPNLPREIWQDLTGLRDLRLAYSRFEARVDGRADAFVKAIMSSRRRLEPPPLSARTA